ncbi:D-alanyl-D-alanine carboxypeptidase family protein [Aquisediminimonas sediminicola]|uniref:D-alanyl-D-alanine carboxypeptidase family protein n=1 Tax=Alteraquisediminimonas sediminicola TaxID=2676787 RepID=UPI001C8E9CB6|nr:D-alanyl-D-alanine carboxypeptidase family protein [Aquisediminimonas sediminicola]
MFGASTSSAAPTIDTIAPVVLLVDQTAGATLFARDADRSMPPASMAKMMTSHVVFSLIKQGKLRLDQMLTVRPETWQKWHGPAAGSTMFLSAGEQVSVENLLHGVITLSGNDACVVLAEGISGTEQAFTDLMNAEAKRLGMTNSHFGTSNGWPDEGVTHVTARDLAKLAASTINDYPEFYAKFYQQTSFSWGKTMGGDAIMQDNRNPILGRVPGADGLKTGHTEEAGYGFTGSAIQNGRRLVLVVAGLNSKSDRVTESVKLMEWGFKAWEAKPLFAKGAQVGKARVQLGSEDEVALTAPRNLAAVMPQGTGGSVKMSIRYDGPIKAPIKAGQHVADLIVTTSDTPPQVMPLVAAVAVDEASWFDRVIAGLKAFFGLA